MTNSRKSKLAAHEKVAQMRADQMRAERQRRIVVASSAVGAVVVLVFALVVARLAGVGAPTATASVSSSASAAVTSAVSGVPSTVLNAVGVGTANNPPTAVKAPALKQAGKPRVLYIGAEYCPYCAAQRWAVAQALSRFGTWEGLGQTTSSASDVDPNTATLSFHGATVVSRYVSFTGVETTTNKPAGSSYQPLDTPAAADAALMGKYDAAPYLPSAGAGGIPFVDIGGAYVSGGASYDPALLAGKTQLQIAEAMKNPADPIAQAIDGAANAITAAVCKITNNQPATVCGGSGVTAAAATLGHG
jgi:Domain of unknown function (DUF929)